MPYFVWTCLWPLLGIFSPFVLCDVVRNYSKKKRLLDQYHTSGIQTIGVILQLQTTIYRSSFGIERRRTHKIVYCYKMEPSGNLCVKTTAISREPASRRIAVVVLPGLEQSGLLQETVDHRESSYGPFKCFFMSLAFLAAHLFGLAVLFVLVFCWDESSCQDDTVVEAYAITVAVFLIIGFFAAHGMYNGWKKRLLYGGRVLERCPGSLGQVESDIPTAEILAVVDGDDNNVDVEVGGNQNAIVEARSVPTLTPLSSNQSTASAPVVAEAIVVQDCHSLSWYDAEVGDPQSQMLREAMKDNNWVVLRDFFSSIRGQHTERSFYIGVIEKVLEESWSSKCQSGGEEQFSPVLDEWIAAEPNNGDACVIRGRCYTKWAWNARGSGYANTVSEEAWPKFFARIDQAEEELNHAMELDSSDALVYSMLVVVSIAKKDRHEAEVCNLVSKLALSDDPNNFTAHTRLLQFYCHKWGGSDEMMFDFARETIKRLPEGHPLWILIVQAHYEAYVGLMAVARQSRHRIAIAAAVAYWQRPNVKQEILRSYHHYIGSAACTPATTAAEASVLMNARNWYAFCLARTGEMEMARRELLLIGRHPTERPWNTLDQYQEACNKAGVCL